MYSFIFSICSIFFLFSVSDKAFASNVTISDEELEILRNSGEEYSVIVSEEQAIKNIAELTGKTKDQVRFEQNSQNKFGVMSTAACNEKTETSTIVPVKSYNMTLLVYLDICRNGSFTYIDTNKKPAYVGIKASTKVFSGDVVVELKGNGFDYLVNGHVYDTGTTSHSGTTGLTLPVWSTTYTVGTASNHYGAISTRF